MTSQATLIPVVNRYLKRQGHHFRLNHQGICNGLVVLFIQMALEKKRAQFFQLKKSLAALDETNSMLSAEESSFIHKSCFAYNPQGFGEKIGQEELEKYVSIFGEPIQHEYTLSLKTHEDVWPSIIRDVCFNNRLIYLGSNEHAMVLYKENEQYFLYDPNYEEDVRVFHDERALVSEIKECFDYNDPFFLLNLKAYASPFSAAKPNYPTKAELLNRVPFDEIESLTTTLVMSAKIGDLTMVDDLMLRFPELETSVALLAASHAGHLTLIEYFLKNDHRLTTEDLIRALKKSISKNQDDAMMLLIKKLLRRVGNKFETLEALIKLTSEGSERENLSLLQSAAKHNSERVIRRLWHEVLSTMEISESCLQDKENDLNLDAISIAVLKNSEKSLALLWPFYEERILLSEEKLLGLIRVAIREKSDKTLAYLLTKAKKNGVSVKHQIVLPCDLFEDRDEKSKVILRLLLKADASLPIETTAVSLLTSVAKQRDGDFLKEAIDYLLRSHSEESTLNAQLIELHHLLNSDNENTRLHINKLQEPTIADVLVLDVLLMRKEPLSDFQFSRRLLPESQESQEKVLAIAILQSDSFLAEKLASHGVCLSTDRFLRLSYHLIKMGKTEGLKSLNDLRMQFPESVWQKALKSKNHKALKLLLSFNNLPDLSTETLIKLVTKVCQWDDPKAFESLEPMLTNKEQQQFFDTPINLAANKVCKSIIERHGLSIRSFEEGLLGSLFQNAHLKKDEEFFAYLLDECQKPITEGCLPLTKDVLHPPFIIKMIKQGLPASCDLIHYCVKNNCQEVLSYLNESMGNMSLSEEMVQKLLESSFSLESASPLFGLRFIGVSLKDLQVSNHSLLHHAVITGKTKIIEEASHLFNDDGEKFEALISSINAHNFKVANIIAGLSLNITEAQTTQLLNSLKRAFSMKYNATSEQVVDKLYQMNLALVSELVLVKKSERVKIQESLYEAGQLLEAYPLGSWQTLQNGKNHQVTLREDIINMKPLVTAYRFFDTNRMMAFIQQGASLTDLPQQGLLAFKKAINEGNEALAEIILTHPQFRDKQFAALCYAAEHHSIPPNFNDEEELTLLLNQALEEKEYLLAFQLLKRLPLELSISQKTRLSPHLNAIWQAYIENAKELITIETNTIADYREELFNQLFGKEQDKSALTHLLLARQDEVLETISMLQGLMEEHQKTLGNFRFVAESEAQKSESYFSTTLTTTVVGMGVVLASALFMYVYKHCQESVEAEDPNAYTLKP